MIERKARPGVILGIWGYSSDAPDVLHHDSGAALIVDGVVKAAISEERLTRVKSEGRWPSRSIAEAISIAGIKPSDIDAVALAGMPPLARSRAMLGELWSNYRATGQWLPERWLYAALTAKKLRRKGPVDIGAPVTFVSHHDAHAASAYYTAPFDKCAVVTLDGIGDSTHSGAVYRVESERLVPVRYFSGYASIGIFYSYVTKAFGFRPARHEGKITGLAAHGDSEILINDFRDRLRYENGRLVSDFVPRLFRSGVDALWETSWIDRLMDYHRREDIAAALQRHTEELCAAVVRDATRDTGCENAALAGGVFANVRVNQRVRQAIPGAVWIHPAMGDAGLALGAALHVHGSQVDFQHAYLGSDVGELTSKPPAGTDSWRMENASLVARVIARACRQGRIVGYASGRMEYGPRALGHRTIFASAEDATINDTLNARLRRTEFMPFAPIMTEAAARRFLIDWTQPIVEDFASRFMTITYDVTDECRTLCPAIVHVDGTARPQVLPAEAGTLRDILLEYGKLSGVEVLINTSFNIHEEPIVRTANDAMRSYREGAVDLLVIGNTAYGASDLIAGLRRET